MSVFLGLFLFVSFSVCVRFDMNVWMSVCVWVSGYGWVRWCVFICVVGNDLGRGDFMFTRGQNNLFEGAEVGGGCATS